ncbi:MAG TPA: metal ABC transporter permease [Thermoanaerobaculia bacterium]|nr:metal ABC transporter permease [Thermoanaerobaculia bacterium]
MIEALQYEFLRNALLAGVLAGVLCGVVGPFVVLQRLVFLSGGVAHAALAGLGLFYLLGWEPRWGAVLVAVVSALLLWRGGGERAGGRDATIGVLWAVGMALGFIFLQRVPGFAPDLLGYLFGDILTVTRGDLAVLAIATAVAVAFVATLQRPLVALAFDEEHARLRGVPVDALSLAHLLLITLTVVLLIQIVGIVLVLALLTLPALIGLPWARSVAGLSIAATVVAVSMSVGGLAVAYRWDLPAGSSVVLLGAAGLAVSSSIRRVRARAAASRGASPGPAS